MHLEETKTDGLFPLNPPSHFRCEERRCKGEIQAREVKRHVNITKSTFHVKIIQPASGCLVQGKTRVVSHLRRPISVLSWSITWNRQVNHIPPRVQSLKASNSKMTLRNTELFVNCWNNRKFDCIRMMSTFICKCCSDKLCLLHSASTFVSRPNWITDSPELLGTQMGCLHYQRDPHRSGNTMQTLISESLEFLPTRTSLEISNENSPCSVILWISSELTLHSRQCFSD